MALNKVESRSKIKDGKATYIVDLANEALSPSDLGDAEHLNQVLVDEYFHDGYLLNDIRYNWRTVDGRACVEVTADASDWLVEAE